MENISVQVTSSYPISFFVGQKLTKFGLYRKNTLCFCGEVKERNYVKLQIYCKKRNLKVCIDNNFGQRNSTYRQTFFANNKPAFGNYYICAYCGKLVNRKNLTVDHLYPIGKVSKSLILQKRLRKRGIKNINNKENLVPACFSCNRKKSDKMGVWILKGRLGTNKKLWIARYIIRILLIIFAIYVVYKYFNIVDLHSFVKNQ